MLVPLIGESYERQFRKACRETCIGFFIVVSLVQGSVKCDSTVCNKNNTTNLSPPTHTTNPPDGRHTSSQDTDFVRQPVTTLQPPCLHTRPMEYTYVRLLWCQNYSCQIIEEVSLCSSFVRECKGSMLMTTQKLRLDGTIQQEVATGSCFTGLCGPQFAIGCE